MEVEEGIGKINGDGGNTELKNIFFHLNLFCLEFQPRSRLILGGERKKTIIEEFP